MEAGGWFDCVLVQFLGSSEGLRHIKGVEIIRQVKIQAILRVGLRSISLHLKLPLNERIDNFYRRIKKKLNLIQAISHVPLCKVK